MFRWGEQPRLPTLHLRETSRISYFRSDRMYSRRQPVPSGVLFPQYNYPALLLPWLLTPSTLISLLYSIGLPPWSNLFHNIWAHTSFYSPPVQGSTSRQGGKLDVGKLSGPLGLSLESFPGSSEYYSTIVVFLLESYNKFIEIFSRGKKIRVV